LSFEELDEIRANNILSRELALLSEEDALCWFTYHVKRKFMDVIKLNPKLRFEDSEIKRVSRSVSFTPGNNIPQCFGIQSLSDSIAART
jgi:hypothetical protein